MNVILRYYCDQRLHSQIAMVDSSHHERKDEAVYPYGRLWTVYVMFLVF